MKNMVIVKNLQKKPMDLQKAILVVSFGTGYSDSRIRSLDLIETVIGQTFTDYRVYRAWTSEKLIRHLQEQDNIKINSVSEAAEQMLKDGITHVAVQPTFITDGVESEWMKKEFSEYQERFIEIRFSTPLLTTSDDYEKVIHAVMSDYSDLKEEEGLLWMGHGAENGNQAVYAAIENFLRREGCKNIFLATFKQSPRLEHMLKLLQETSIKKIHLIPFMVVAGGHARHDMAGEKADSWENILKQAGYEVECHMKGLGEYPEVRKVYLEHLQKIMEG